jgi:phage/plasmid-like protein (TIGR03299 family)
VPVSRVSREIDTKDWKAIVREDTGALISIMRGSYAIVQNDRLWDIADTLVDEEKVKYETAGVLKNGAVLWVLARLNEPSRVNGDDTDIYPYALVSTAHDGSGACKASAVSIRVICWNTFNSASAQSRSSGRQFTFRHTKNVIDRIDDAKAALGLIRHQHEEFIHLANDLAELHVTDDGVRDFLATFIPDPTADVLTDRQKRNISEARQLVRETLDLSPTIPQAHRRTAYGLWTAGIEFLDHLRQANSSETLFRRTMLDTSTVKSKLMDAVRKVAV